MTTEAMEEAVLDPVLNHFPERVRNIHIMGICGTGMAALAGMLKHTGYQVSGSDVDVYPPMSDFLAQAGITVHGSYSPRNLHPRPDLVIVGNVITRKNPESIALAESHIPYVSFPQALANYFLAGKKSIVITGTHGKTTTSSILASLLHTTGQNPSFMIGGLVQGFGRNFNIGTGECFVVEGDEYDTSFFDKGPKFLHYQPNIAVITSIEFDHADIYKDLEAIKKSFQRLVKILPQNGYLFACFDDPLVREVVAGASCNVVGYGRYPDCIWTLENVKINKEGTSFSVKQREKEYGDFFIPMPGRHNAMNALSVIGVLDLLGVEQGSIAKGLADFKGVKRRQEVRGVSRGVTVIDDFAHHPTAVRETLAALKAAYNGKKIIAVFEPRTNSSRRSVFQKTYVSSFDSADQVIVKEPLALTGIPEKERFSSRQLVLDLNKREINANYFAETDKIIEYLATNASAGDVVAVLSNGSFDNIHARLLETLACTPKHF